MSDIEYSSSDDDDEPYTDTFLIQENYDKFLNEMKEYITTAPITIQLELQRYNPMFILHLASYSGPYSLRIGLSKDAAFFWDEEDLIWAFHFLKKLNCKCPFTFLNLLCPKSSLCPKNIPVPYVHCGMPLDASPFS